MKAKKKKTLKIILIIFLTLVLLIGILCFWDPTGFLGIRYVGRARGTYYVQDEEIEQEVPFTVEYFTVDIYTVDIVIKAGDEQIDYFIDDYIVGHGFIRFFFDYDDVDYSINCKRSSTKFKLIGEMPCDLLKCSMSVVYSEGASIKSQSVQKFNGVLK